MKNRSVDNDGNNINWLKIKGLRFEKDQPNKVKFWYDYEGDFKVLDVSLSENEQKYMKNKRISFQANKLPHLRLRVQFGRPETDVFSYERFRLKNAYSKPLKITKAKKNDLLKLCRQGVIPNELHSWYESLQVVDVSDPLPEPDLDDDSEEDDN